MWSHFCWKLQPGSSCCVFKSCFLCQITLTLQVDEDTSIVWFRSLKRWKEKEILPRSEHRSGLFSIIVNSCSKLQNCTYSPKECPDIEVALLKTVVSAKRSGDSDVYSQRWHWACFYFYPRSSSRARWRMSDCLPISPLLSLFLGLDFTEQFITYLQTYMWGFSPP